MSYIGTVDKHRVATYIRWSTDEQTDGTTLEVQVEACRLFIQSQGWVYRDDLVFIDDGYSGGSLERPGLTRLRQLVGDGQVSCVVVYKLDRLSRSVLDTVTLVLQEWEGVCSIRSTREPVDTTNPAGSILFYMLASYAEWERSTIRERTMSGKIKRAQQGRCPGFAAPYGYARGPQVGQWVVHEAESVILRRIFREYVGGRGIHSIAAGLNADGVRPRRGAFWHGENIMKMLGNPVYTGVLRYGMSAIATKAQRKQVGRSRVFFAEPRYAYVEDAVPALIAKADFERAQAVRASRGVTTGCRARSADFLLTGIARCRCGSTIRGDGRAGGARRYYRCAGSLTYRPNRCAGGLIAADVLEARVLAQVREALSASNRAALLAGWRRENAAKDAIAQQELERLRAAQQQVGRSRAKIMADYTAGDLPARLYVAHMEDLDRESEAQRTAAATLTDQIARLRSANGEVAELAELAQRLDSWASLSREEQKQALRHAVGACVVYRESARRRRGGQGGPIEVDLQIRQVGGGAVAPRVAGCPAPQAPGLSTQSD